MSNWISVKDGLPECDPKWGNSKIVWCVDAFGRTGFGIYTDGTKQLQHDGWFTGGSVGEDSVMITYWMYIPESPAQKRWEPTNGDTFRKMTDEELAVTLMCPNEMGMAEIPCDHSDDKNCCQCLLDWLRQPEEGSAR